MGDKPLVAIIDDEILVRNSLKRVFAKDYSIEEFSSGEEFLEYTATSPKIYAIITDHDMLPGINGSETIKQLKESYPQIYNETKIIGMTAREDNHKSFRKAGIKNIVVKPLFQSQIQEIKDYLA